MINIISFGAGQNSTAMIIWMKNNNIPVDNIIFADTGNEMPETYEFLKEFKIWCLIKEIPFNIVTSKLGNLKSYYESQKLIPYRMFRHCTHKFKVIPIDNYVKEKYGKKTEIDMYMGISVEEKKRCDKITGRKPITYHFPLVDENIDRNGCVEIIKKEGLSVPVKSGCYFCPFQTKRIWVELYKKHKDLFDISNKFEKNGRAYPDGNFMGNMTLETLKKIITEQKSLKDFEEDVKLPQCVYCHT